MVMGECVAYNSPAEDSTVKFADDLYELAPAHIHPSDLRELSKWFCHR